MGEIKAADNNRGEIPVEVKTRQETTNVGRGTGTRPTMKTGNPAPQQEPGMCAEKNRLMVRPIVALKLTAEWTKRKLPQVLCRKNKVCQETLQTEI